MKILILLTTLSLVACGQNAKTSKTEISQNLSILEQDSNLKDFEKVGFDLMNRETLNELRLGLDANELIKLLAEPSEKSESELWAADGAYHQTFKYPNHGIEIDLTGEKNVDQKVNMITIYSPCNYKTNKGVSIGSDFKTVEQAYKEYLNPENSNKETIVAGSIYGGLIFRFENEKVKSIFIGISAE